MATVKYFAGDLELSSIDFRGKSANDPASFWGYPEGVTPVFVQGQGWVGRVQADRKVIYKSNPSGHECDARCFNATGRVMQCECSCGGKNHGLGAFKCDAA